MEVVFHCRVKMNWPLAPTKFIMQDASWVYKFGTKINLLVMRKRNWVSVRPLSCQAWAWWLAKEGETGAHTSVNHLLALMCGWCLTFFTSSCEEIFWQKHLEGGRVCSAHFPRTAGTWATPHCNCSGEAEALHCEAFSHSFTFLSHCFLAPLLSCFAHHLFIVGSSTNFRINKNIVKDLVNFPFT